MPMSYRYLSRQWFGLITGLIILSACTTAPYIPSDRGPAPGSIDVSSVPDAVPRIEPRSRYGNPVSYVVNGKRYYVMGDGKNFLERGIASWYGEKFHGRTTSSGERYDMYAMTAAHKSLPLPSYIEVINIKNGRKVIVRVNDRGPFHENRIVDLSYTAAAKLDILRDGTGLVEIRSIDPDTYGKPQADNNELRPVRTNRVTSISENGFYIQVGAYSELNNAIKMRERLEVLAESLLDINEASINGQSVYRVRFGPITDISLADHIVENLHFYGVFDHYITID
jgi:rare lipoprotein A